MAELLIGGAAAKVKSQFSWKEVDSSNTVFKLFAKASVGLCLFASILVASAEYLGAKYFRVFSPLVPLKQEKCILVLLS